MTNFEHYKDEIVNEFGNYNAKKALSHLNAKYHFVDCFDAFVKWGYQEYVEPYKLTQFEKGILGNLSNSYIYIRRDGQTNRILLNENIYNCDLVLSAIFPNISYDCLDWDEDYKISDILANCEVID